MALMGGGGVLYVKSYGVSSVECHVDVCEGWMSYAFVNKAVSLVNCKWAR